MTGNQHPFKKKWGQNFLRDLNTINKIINCLEPCSSDTVLEIGPGDGALTNVLYKQIKKLHAVEIDPLLTSQLKHKKFANTTIYEDDILKWDLNKISQKAKIIGNLPYYISSPILFKLLEWQNWDRMVLMFQKELAQRITSKYGNRTYGRISVMCQVYCSINIEFIVSNHVFQPKPEVDSAVLSFYPKNLKLPEINNFSKMIKKAFSQRRKKIKNNLSEAYKMGQINKWADKRPEELSPNEFIEIYNTIFIGK